MLFFPQVAVLVKAQLGKGLLLPVRTARGVFPFLVTATLHVEKGPWQVFWRKKVFSIPNSRIRWHSMGILTVQIQEAFSMLGSRGAGGQTGREEAPAQPES